MGHRIDVRKLELFNRISKEGSRKVAESLTQLTGLDAEITVTKLNFLDSRTSRHTSATTPPWASTST